MPVKTSPVPAAAKTLIKRLPPGWSHKIMEASGETDFGGLSEETDGEGKRHKVVNIEPVRSYRVSGWHTDGRGFVAVWVNRVSKGGWTLDICWRARHRDEFTPTQLTAGQLGPYVDAPDPQAAMSAVFNYDVAQHAKLAERRKK